MDSFFKTLLEFSDIGIATIGIVVSLATVIASFRAGVLKSLRIGSLELKTNDAEIQEVSQIIEHATYPETNTVPFETKQLASYYSQVLAQSKVSFWFSLVFASIGFLIIVLAAFMHADSESGSTIARFVAGGVVDAVAALFFVQSKRAQESMAEFFDKLRRDRNHVEARKLCDSLENNSAKDALRIRLSLHYSEVSDPESITESIMANCLRELPKEN